MLGSLRLDVLFMTWNHPGKNRANIMSEDTQGEMMRILSLIIAAVLVAYVMRQDDRDDAADSDDAPEPGKAAGTDGASACEDAADGDANDDAVQAGDGTDATDDSDA